MIVTYGYGPNLAKFSNSADNIHAYGEELLCSIHNFHIETIHLSKELPIYFIAHSMGGLILENALCISVRSGESLRTIAKRTAGILFLGTPHSSDQLTNWGWSISRLIPARLRKGHEPELEGLKVASNVYATVDRSFQLDIKHGDLRHISIFTFYESLPLPGMKLIVPKSSTALSSVPSAPIHGTHISMTKFESALDSEYAKVKGSLLSWILPTAGEASIKTLEGPVRIIHVNQAKGKVEDISRDASLLIVFVILISLFEMLLITNKVGQKQRGNRFANLSSSGRYVEARWAY